MKLTYSQYQIFDYIPGFVYLQASDYSIVYANKRFIELFGEPEGRHCYELIKKRNTPCETCPTFNVFRTKEPLRIRWESPSGRIYMVYKNYFVDDDNRGLILSIGMDITEEEKAREVMEELTRKQKEQIKIIDSGPAVVFLWKAKENWPVATVSNNVSRFGYDPDDFITGIISYADIIHPDDLPSVISEVEYNSENHIDDYTQEYRIFGKDSAEYWVEDHTLIRRDESGIITHYQGIVLDITDRKKAEDAIKRKLEFQETISTITSRFTGIYDFDNAINGTLADIGRLSRADRAYLVQLRENGTIMDNTHEWCAEGVTPQIENLRDLPSDMFPWWIKMIRNRENIQIPDVSKMLPEAKAEREILEKQNVRSILVLPVFCGDEPAGFMGFDNVSETGEWTKEDFLLLNTATEIVGRILELRRMHSALMAEEVKYREFFRTSQDAVFITSIKGGLEDFNDTFVSMFGYESGDELKKVPVPMLYANPEDRKDHIGSIIKKGFTNEYPVDLRKKDGTVISTLISSVVRKDEDGDVIGFQGTIRDITVRKIAEEALKESNERFYQLFENMSSGVAIYEATENGKDFIFMNFNKAAEKIEKINRNELIGKKVSAVFPGVVEFGLFEVFQRVWRTGIPEKFPLSFYKDERITGWRENYVYKLLSGEIVAIYDDVTERKLTEKKIKDLNSLLRSIRDVNHLIVKEHDIKLLMQGACEILEQTRDYQSIEIALLDDETGTIRPVAGSGIYGLRDWYFSLDENGNAPKCIRECLKTGHRIKVMDSDNYCKGCEYFEKHFNKDTLVIPILQNKRIVGIFLVVLLSGHEISQDEIELLEEIAGDLGFAREKYLVEDALQKSEEKFRSYIEKSPVGVFITDDQGRYIEVNPAASVITGYSSEELLSMQISDIIAPQSFDAGIEYFQKVVKSGYVSGDTQFVHKSGEVRYWRVDAVRLSRTRLLGFAEDITDGKIAEEALKEKTYILNERVKELTALKKISDLLITPVPDKNIFQGIIDAIVPAMQYPESTTARILYDGDEYVSEDFVKSEWKIDKKLIIQGEEKGILEVYYNKKMPGADIGPFLIEEDNLLEIISHRLEAHLSRQYAEENLISAHNRLNNIINFLPDATFVVDRESKVFAWNNAIENMTGISRDKILDKGDYLYSYAIYKENWPILVDYVRNPEEELPERYKNVRRGANYISAEVDLQEVFKGKGAYVLAIASILYDGDGNIDGAIESIRDISDLKRKENDLLKTLEEKNTAINEIHHRVKNNLQIISALIQMHYYKVGEEEYARLFENLNNRVLAIANVYENLIEREEFLEIYMPKLINDLISNAMLSHPHTTNLSIDTDVMDESMDLNVAVSLSMIISELLINIVKHAFVGRKKGNVRVYFQRDGEKGYLLEISDDGVGYRGETNLSKAETLGMRLVGILVENNLHGTLDIEVNGGTKFTIRFVP